MRFLISAHWARRISELFIPTPWGPSSSSGGSRGGGARGQRSKAGEILRIVAVSITFCFFRQFFPCSFSFLFLSFFCSLLLPAPSSTSKHSLISYPDYPQYGRPSCSPKKLGCLPTPGQAWLVTPPPPHFIMRSTMTRIARLPGKLQCLADSVRLGGSIHVCSPRFAPSITHDQARRRHRLDKALIHNPWRD